ncbi:MAG: acetyltransferase [Anaerolineae bacterium]|nr:acetyltransferase [Anaerolineae bacterium]
MGETERLALAEAVRAACLRAALNSYENARTDGLCDAGAFELAIDAVRSLDLRPVVDSATGSGGY